MEKRCVFISHSKQDIAKVNPLIEQLKKDNYEVIRSSHSAKGDGGFIERACASIVCLSVHYSAEDSCHSEFLMLHWQEKPMVPVILDSVSWPPGDNLFIHRDFFWSLSSVMLDLSDGRSGAAEELVSRLNTALGITTQQDDSWSVGARKSAPSPAALSSSQQKSRDDNILAQLTAKSAEYQNLASAPASVSGRDRARSGRNSIDQSTNDRVRSAASRRGPSSVYTHDSRRSSLMTIEGSNEPNIQDHPTRNPKSLSEDSAQKSEKNVGDENQCIVNSDNKEEKVDETCDSPTGNVSNLTGNYKTCEDNEEKQSDFRRHDQGTSVIKTQNKTDSDETSQPKILNRTQSSGPKMQDSPKQSKSCAIL